MKTVDKIIEEYSNLQKENIKKKSQVMTILIIGFSILLVISFLLSDITLFFVFIWVSLGLLGLSLLLLLIFNYSVPEKPLYNYLYKEIIEDINYDNSNYFNITYESYSKDKDFVKDGGLFTRMSSKMLRFKISFRNQEGKKITLYDAYIYTQSNNATVVHLNGNYIIMETFNNDYFQLRHNGRPALKGIKFEKVVTDDVVKHYIEQDSNKRIESKYIGLYQSLKDNDPKRKVFIGGIPNELHLASFNSFLPRKVKVLDRNLYGSLRATLVQTLLDLEQYYSAIDY